VVVEDHFENFGHQCVFVKMTLKRVWRCEFDSSGSGYVWFSCGML